MVKSGQGPLRRTSRTVNWRETCRKGGSMAGTARAGVRLTARGAIVMLFVVTLLGRFLPLPLSGLAFVAGCVAAVLLALPRDLLPLVVTPPLVFFAATALVELVRSLGAGSPL